MQLSTFRQFLSDIYYGFIHITSSKKKRKKFSLCMFVEQYPQYAHCLKIFASLGYCWALLHQILNLILVNIDSILFCSILKIL